MIDVAYCPKWFYGKDIAIDIFSILTMLWVAYFAFRWYRLNKNKKHMSLALGFFLISLSFIFKILTNFTIYQKILQTSQVGLISITYETVQQSDILFFIGFFLFRFLMLTGLYVLMVTYEKHHSWAEALVFGYLIIISTVFSKFVFFLFHMSALLFLLIITTRYVQNYRRNKSPSALFLAGSFGVLSLSQLVFIFTFATLQMYVMAELIQLAGYVLLFITLFMVLWDGKKKKQNRHNR